MKELKFRAWDEEKKKIYHSVVQIIFGKPYNFIMAWDGIEQTSGTRWKLMQFTGLKDKSGKEIYESDVVKFKEPKDDKEKISEIKYYAPEFCCEGQEFYGKYVKFSEMQIIGNKFENPELLKNNK